MLFHHCLCFPKNQNWLTFRMILNNLLRIFFVDKGQESKILGFFSFEEIIGNRVLERLHRESRNQPASHYL